MKTLRGGGPDAGEYGLRRPGSYSSLSHGTGLHADDCLEPAFQPRALVINNLVDTVSDEDLQKDLEVRLLSYPFPLSRLAMQWILYNAFHYSKSVPVS